MNCTIKTLTISVALLLAFPVANARIARSYAAKVAFVKTNACPLTGLHKLPCKNYVIDHITPLACGGADSPSNMQWQRLAESKAKDKWERKGCIPK